MHCFKYLIQPSGKIFYNFLDYPSHTATTKNNNKMSKLIAIIKFLRAKDFPASSPYR